MDFPKTAEDFKHLNKQGKDVVYWETNNEDAEPDYDGYWSFHSTKRLPDGSVYNWAAIMTFEEAEQYAIERELREFEE